MFWDSDFFVQFLPWLFTNLSIFNQCKCNIQNKRMKIAESKIEYWKSNIEQLDPSKSIEAIALHLNIDFLCWTEKISMLRFDQFKGSCKKTIFLQILPHSRFKMILIGKINYNTRQAHCNFVQFFEFANRGKVTTLWCYFFAQLS